MNRNVFSRIELIFWNFTIQTLSQPGFARTIILEAMRLMQKSEATVLGILLGVCAVVGLVSGYLFYFIAANLR